jgi:hypothetical protein
MASDRASLQALKNIIEDVDLILENTPSLPQNRTGRSRELLSAALKLTDDMLKNSRSNAALILGRKGGSTTARKLTTEHHRKMAARAKPELAAGRASRQSNSPAKIVP